MSSPKKQPCKVCDGSGQVREMLPDTLLDFYGDEVRQAKADGATIKTVFRCDHCHGTGAT